MTPGIGEAGASATGPTCPVLLRAAYDTLSLHVPVLFLGGVDVMQSVAVAALIGLGLCAPAIAGGIVPDEFQGVWAAARDCKANLQNVLSNAVDRERAACRVTKVETSGSEDSYSSAVSLTCGDAQAHEIWRSETVGDADYLIIVRFQPADAAQIQSIDLYKRCPGIPSAEIALSEIPGNPVAEPAAEENPAPAPHVVQSVRSRTVQHARPVHIRRHGSQ
jgi:hypothetical protein